MAQLIATAASLVAAVCNIVLMVLHYRWYGPKSGKRQVNIQFDGDINRLAKVLQQDKDDTAPEVPEK